ncbi:MAG: zf-TFIIB domain-containing protein [Polyangia bacterium]
MSPYSRSEKEEEYFLKKEAERLRQQAEEHRRALEEAERERLEELHWMRCPKCGMEMKEIVYQGIHIDNCFSCGGIYLDDGELGQIVDGERSDGVLSRISGIFRTGKRPETSPEV